MGPFALKFFSPIQNNIGQNFGDGLNFVTCEQDLRKCKGIRMQILLTLMARNATIFPNVIVEHSINQPDSQCWSSEQLNGHGIHTIEQINVLLLLNVSMNMSQPFFKLSHDNE